MNRIVSVVRMHLSRVFTAVLMPVFLSVGVVAAMIIVVAAINAAGVDTRSTAFADGMSTNGGITFTLMGFLIALGVTSATACFAFATSLGVTRRHYVAGTAAFFMIQTVLVTALLSLLLLLEKITDHWFIGARALDVVTLGSGDWGRFLVIVSLGVLMCLSLGALFGASWLRFGMRGPLIIAGAVVVLLAVGVFLAIPRFAEIMAALTFAVVPAVFLVVTAVALIGAAAFLSRASVRGS